MTPGMANHMREAGEFLVADTLLIVGSCLIGAGGSLPLFFPVAGYLFIVLGLILAVRVFVVVSKSLSKIHEMINNAISTLQSADEGSKKSAKRLKKQSMEIEGLYNRIRITENRINVVMQRIDAEHEKIKNESEKIFGSSSTFSRYSWTSPLEKDIESIKGRLKALEDDNTRHGYGRFGSRRSWV